MNVRLYIQPVLSEKQCINVLKVFDWVNRFVNIKLKEALELKKIVKDNEICCDFSSPCDGTRTTIWTGMGLKNITGSFVIRYCTGCDGTMDVIVNGEKLSSLRLGQTFSATIDRLKTIEVQCNSEPKTGFCDGNLKINVHFDPIDDDLDLKNVICFLSDCEGNPLDPLKPESIDCEEISDPTDRRNVIVTLPNGKTVTLQEIEILKQGFVTVQFFNKRRKVKKTCTFSFLK